MAIYKIISVSPQHGMVRSEYIDSKKNEMFHGVKSGKDVKRRYEEFWAGDTKVSSVTKVTIKSQGKNWGIKMKKLKSVV